MSEAGRLIAAIALVGTLLALTASAVAASPTPPVERTAQVPQTYHLEPVYLTFSPRNVTGVPGGSVTVHGAVQNNGSYAFNASKCYLWYRVGTSGNWTLEPSCFSSATWPISFGAHSKHVYTFSQKVSPSFPAGLYEWKVDLWGTYHGLRAYSHVGDLSVKIT